MRAAINDITGDKIRSKSNNSNYSDNYDKIFGNKNKESDPQGDDISKDNGDLNDGKS